nr:FxLYD domain-containing protein [Burkholderia multivorans]
MYDHWLNASAYLLRDGRHGVFSAMSSACYAAGALLQYGKVFEMKIGRVIVGAVLAVSSIVAFAANGALKLNDDLRVVPNPPLPYGALTGSAVNTSDKVLGVATITFNLYDSANNQIGNAVAQGVQIAPGQRWIYNAPATVQFDHATVSNVSAF